NHGGVLTGPERWAGQPRYDLATAASSGRAFLLAGYRDAALATAEFINGALQHQRDPSTGLDLSFGGHWEVIAPSDGSDRTYYRFDLTKRGEKVWFAAFPCAVLCE